MSSCLRAFVLAIPSIWNCTPQIFTWQFFFCFAFFKSLLKCHLLHEVLTIIFKREHHIPAPPVGLFSCIYSLIFYIPLVYYIYYLAPPLLNLQCLECQAHSRCSVDICRRGHPFTVPDILIAVFWCNWKHLESMMDFPWVALMSCALHFQDSQPYLKLTISASSRRWAVKKLLV